MKNNTCEACKRSTSGDCGQHDSATNPTPTADNLTMEERLEKRWNELRNLNNIDKDPVEWMARFFRAELDRQREEIVREIEGMKKPPMEKKEYIHCLCGEKIEKIYGKDHMCSRLSEKAPYVFIWDCPNLKCNQRYSSPEYPVRPVILVP